MNLANFAVDVVQNILVAFEPAQGFNNWSQKSYQQGFTWRPRSVSFLTLEEGLVQVEAHTATTVDIRTDAVRVIVVPFDSSGTGVEITGIYEGAKRLFQLPEGRYALYCEQGFTGRMVSPSQDEPDVTLREVWCRLTWVPDPAPIARILRHDTGLNPPSELVMDGEPV